MIFRLVIHSILVSAFVFALSPAFCQQAPDMDIASPYNKRKARKEKQSQNQLAPSLSYFSRVSLSVNIGSNGLALSMQLVQNVGKVNTNYNFQLEDGLHRAVGLVVRGEDPFYQPDAEIPEIARFFKKGVRVGSERARKEKVKLDNCILLGCPGQLPPSNYRGFHARNVYQANIWERNQANFYQ